MPKLTYAALKEIAKQHGVEFQDDSKDEKQTAKLSERDDFDKVTDWLLEHYPYQDDKIKKLIAHQLIPYFSTDSESKAELTSIELFPKDAFSEKVKTALYRNLINSLPTDENQVTQWLIKYDSKDHNGFGNLILDRINKKIAGPLNLDALDNIATLLEFVQLPTSRMEVALKLKQAVWPHAKTEGFPAFLADLSVYYAQAAKTYEEQNPGFREEAFDSKKALSLSHLKILDDIEVNQGTPIDEIKTHVLLILYDYLIVRHGTEKAALIREPVPVEKIKNELCNRYGFHPDDHAKAKESSYYRVFLEKHQTHPHHFESTHKKNPTKITAILADYGFFPGQTPITKDTTKQQDLSALPKPKKSRP